MTRLSGVAAALVAVALGIDTASAEPMRLAEPVAAAQPAVLDPAGISAAVRSVMRAGRIPGLAVEVVDHGRVVMRAGYGVKDIGTNEPVDAETRFEIGAISREFTAAAILQLKERGTLALTDRLDAYLPAMTNARGVTIEQVLRQMSGLPDYRKAPGFDALATTSDGDTVPLVALVAPLPLRFAPGARWQSSATNDVVLARVVEIASGMPWDAYVRRHLFAAAGMTHSESVVDGVQTRGVPTGYTVDATRTVVSRPKRGPWGIGSRLLLSTVDDLVRWDEALFGGRIISSDDLALMTTSGVWPNGAPTNYGFGLLVDREAGQQRFWDGGSTAGFAAVNQVFPVLDERIVVLANANFASANGIAGKIFAALHPDLAAALARAADGEDPAITARARAWLRRFQTGAIDRTQLTPAMDAALTPESVMDTTVLRPFGDPVSFVYRGKHRVTDGTVYDYRVTFATTSVIVVHMTLDAGRKIAAYSFAAGE